MQSYTVLSIQIGRARAHPPAEPGGKSWRSAIDKQPISGPLALGSEGLEGDAQADRRFHGGPERALLAYDHGHYAGWREELGRGELPPGSFGENLTVVGLSESEACIGDRFSLGLAVVQISQPRVPCVKLARRLATPDIVARAFATGRTGFYLRVLREGRVSAGPLVLLERPFPELTVALGIRRLVDPVDDPAMNALASCPLLSDDYRRTLVRALSRARSMR